MGLNLSRLLVERQFRGFSCALLVGWAQVRVRNFPITLTYLDWGTSHLPHAFSFSSLRPSFPTIRCQLSPLSSGSYLFFLLRGWTKCLLSKSVIAPPPLMNIFFLPLPRICVLVHESCFSFLFRRRDAQNPCFLPFLSLSINVVLFTIW